MAHRVLLAALAAAIFFGAAAHTLGALNERSLALAEVSRDICYSRHDIALADALTVPEAIRNECTRPMRIYEAGRIWRYVFAAAVGATGALLIVGGILILVRRRQPAAPPGR